MQYKVLARKWRPQKFQDLAGQEHVSRTLLNALKSGRVAHAFLFSGPRGTGKTTTARILAKALNCHEGKAAEPCGRCVACLEIAAGNCMDVMEIDAASNRGIDEIRDLREKVRYNPARDKYKIFIIDEVHMLTAEAFNALLKTLEEPPHHVVFILATTEYHKIPATILSRCQQYGFKLLKLPLIFERLRFIAGSEGIQISDKALEQVAYSSGGSMRDAMSAFDQVIAFSGQMVRDEDVTMLLGLVEPDLLGKIVRAVAANDTDRMLGVVADLVEAGQDLQNFCRRLLGHFRNLMVMKAGVTDPSVLGVPESQVPDLAEQAALYSQEDLLRLFDSFLKVEAELKYSAQARFQLEMGLIELAQIARLRSLEDLISDFSRFVEGEEPPASGGPGPALRTAVPRASEEARERSPKGAPTRERPPGKAPAGRPAKGTEDSASASMAMPPAAEPGPAGEGAGRLLDRIASRVTKASLAPILHSLPGAEMRGDTLVLDPGALNEFVRRQLKDNLSYISEAASALAGRPVKVSFEGSLPPPATPPSESSRPAPPADPEDVLERARREPAVRSFLETFPGPVKAEKVDP